MTALCCRTEVVVVKPRSSLSNVVVAVAALQLKVISEFGGMSVKPLLLTAWLVKSNVNPDEGTGEFNFITFVNQM